VSKKDVFKRINTTDSKATSAIKMSGQVAQQVLDLRNELLQEKAYSETLGKMMEYKNKQDRIFGWVCFIGAIVVTFWDIVQGWLSGTTLFSSNYSEGIGIYQGMIIGVLTLLWIKFGVLGGKK
jgi:hypothetical protein